MRVFGRKKPGCLAGTKQGQSEQLFQVSRGYRGVPAVGPLVCPGFFVGFVTTGFSDHLFVITAVLVFVTVRVGMV